MATNNTPSEVGADNTATGPAPDTTFQDALAAIGTVGANQPHTGSGSGKKAPDPYAPIVRSFFSSYFKLWGTLPPPGYVEKKAREMNLYEFIESERKKPAFRETETYKSEAARLVAVRDQVLGYY